MTLRIRKVWKNLSTIATVPLDNIAAYNYLGSHEGGRSKNIFGSCGSNV